MVGLLQSRFRRGLGSLRRQQGYILLAQHPSQLAQQHRVGIGIIFLSRLQQAAGIGGGVNSAATTSQIVINGGNITAIGGRFATGIGDGDSISNSESSLYQESYAIVINGGTVNAYGGTSSAAIGTTDNITAGTSFGKTSGLSITIAGGVVSAQSGEATGEGSATAAIGSGENTDMVDNSITIDSSAKVIAASFSQYAISGCGTDASLVPIVNIDPSGYMYLARFAASSTERIFTLYPVKTDLAGNSMLISVKASGILNGTIPDGAAYYALDREKNEYYCVDAYGNAIGADGAILENGERYYPAEIPDISYYYDTSIAIDTVSVPGKYTAAALTLPDPAEYGGCYVVHVPDGDGGADNDIYAVLHKYQSGTTSGKIEYQGDYHVSKGENHTDRETPSVVEDPTAKPLTDLRIFPLDPDTGEAGSDFIGTFASNTYGYTVYLPYGTTNLRLYSAYAVSDDVISVSVSGSTVTSQTLHYTNNGLFMEHTLDVSIENEESVDIWIRKTDRSTGVGSDPYLVYKITVIVKKMYMIGMNPLDKLYDGIVVSALPDRVILPSGYRYDISEGLDSNVSSSVSCEGIPGTVIDTFKGSFESGSLWNGKRELSVATSAALDADSHMISIITSISGNRSSVQIVTQVNLKASSSESRITYSNNPSSIDYFNIVAQNGKITLVSQYNSAYSYEILNVALPDPEIEYELTEEQIEANRHAVIEELKETTRNAVENNESLTESSENGQYNKGNQTVRYTLTVEGMSSSAGDTVMKAYEITDTTDAPIMGNVRVVATYHAEEDITSQFTETEKNAVEYRYYRDVNGNEVLDSDDELLSAAPKDAGKYFVTASLTTQTYEAYGGLSFTIFRKEIKVVAVEHWRTYLSPQELASYDGIITDLGQITVSGVLPGEAVVLLTDSIVGKYVDSGGGGYADDIGYHERKIRLTGVYLDPAEPVNANYIFSGMRRVCVWKYEILPADPEVTFPTVEVTYGDSLRKAVRTGQSGNGVFRFADNTAMLTVAENQSEQEMIFTPFNPNYKTVTSSVPVTVLPRKLTIRPDRMEKEYGQTITEYTWSISDGSLAGDDQLEDLKINVTLTAGNAEKENCKVGLYDITEKTPLTADNVNYTVLFKPGTLQVQPKPLGVAWNTDGTVIDTGKEANVSAEFTGVLFEDDCKAVVEGGNEIKTGTYTATIVGMIGEQSDNYVLHGEDTDYQIEYQIVKKEETKNPTDSKETSTGTAGKKPTGTSVSGKQVKTAKTGDSISYIWILMIAGSIAVIGGMIYVIRRRKQK